MYYEETLEKTFDLGIEAFNFTTGEVSLLPEKSLSQGYRLGYTNDIKVGMSGGPIFNDLGLLIGINGQEYIGLSLPSMLSLLGMLKDTALEKS